ncbi:N-acyl amino acid synthase FeeM domain-containing protein [Mesorhizobium marinum]|uniref:N-acyl amino acid synthase FeeM catalytic core domain-containing protein n=1 Tax=Mesorhizobium marinum TaxID=3228790 RepID=A0ABV3QWP8_9HYPH
MTSENASPEASSFVRKVESLLERTEYRRCDKGEDLEDVYRLRYKAYRSNDMVPYSDSHIIHDELDETPNVYRFGIYVDQQLVSTLRIHHVTSATPLSPSSKAFGDIVYPMLDAGDTFICPSRFASDPEWTRVYPQLPYVVLRLAPMACFHFRAPYGLSTVREDHAGFYKRIYHSEQISEPRSYPGVYNRVILFRTDANKDRESQLKRFPFFKSTPMEQRMLFAKPARGELPPLTILPTAKYYREAA